MLYAGPEAAIDGSDACQFHGIRAVSPDPALVHIVVPWEHRARNVRYLHVRRTRAEIVTVETDLVRYVDPATAAMTVARGSYGARRAMAVLSDTLQRRLATYEELLQAHVRGTPRNARMLDEILASLASGVRSVPENDFRQLVQASRLLPTPLYNCLLRLPCGRLISPDALIQDAGLVHESNGRLAHAREDLFEDMQERHDVMTAAGLTVLHNPPRRLKTQGRIAIGEVERCYVRLAGNGMPPGVVIVRRSAD